MGLAAKILPPMVIKEILKVTNVARFGIDVSHNGSGTFGLGLDLLANGIDEEVSLLSLALVLPSSTVAIDDEDVNELASFTQRAGIHHSPATINSFLESTGECFDSEHGVL